MTSRPFPLRVLAGKRAFSQISSRGLRLQDVGAVVAAAGGTKFLMLGGLDRVLFRELSRLPRASPLHCVGSSIGSFRLACLCCKDPAAALSRLAEACISMSSAPASELRSSVIRTLAASLLDGESIEDIVHHSRFRLHVLASRCHGLTASERPYALLAGLGLAAAGNLVSRRTLAWQFTRAIFHAAGDAGPLSELHDFPTDHLSLTATNMHAVLVASAAVPLFVPGVTVSGAVHRDAAIVDYHPAPALAAIDGLVLYPHYYEHLAPGWFDRHLPFRRTRGPVLDSAVLITPSESFIARLPRGTRPSRRAAARLPVAERVREWRTVWTMGAELGEALETLLGSPERAAELVEPFGTSAQRRNANPSVLA